MATPVLLWGRIIRAQTGELFKAPRAFYDHAIVKFDDFSRALQ
jgi:hypothetical protein